MIYPQKIKSFLQDLIYQSRIAVKLRSNIALFNKTKHAEPSKKIVIA